MREVRGTPYQWRLFGNQCYTERIDSNQSGAPAVDGMNPSWPRLF